MIVKNPNQNILIVGTGYVGLITALGLAELGHTVSCYDINPKQIEKLNKSISPIYEPGVEDLLKKGVENKKLHFFDSLAKAYNGEKYIFVAVQTPMDENGKTDMTMLNDAITSIARLAKGPTNIIIKSTVPVGLFDDLKELSAVKKQGKITFVSCPEFLAEGSAIRNFFNPARTIVGSDNDELSKEIAGLFYGLGGSYIITNIETAQMIKYSANAFLATRVAFINDIAELCEKIGVNANDVSRGMTIDPRLGGSHLMPGMSFCGPCLPKDISALIERGEAFGVPSLLLRGAKDHNESHIRHIIDSILGRIDDGATVAIFGLSFKPGTDDVRNAFSLRIINVILEAGKNRVRATDPHSLDSAKVGISHESLSFFEDPFETAKGSDLQLFLTPWEEYTHLDMKKLGSVVNKKNIYDTMQMIDEEKARKAGFSYMAVGRYYGDAGSPSFEISDNPTVVAI